MSTIATARPGLTELGPIAQLRAGRLGRRLPQLYVGLVLYGVSLALMVRGHLGLAPWDVLHSGLTRYVPLTIGQVLVVVSFLVLLLWIPLRETPGLGTISNAIVIGFAPVRWARQLALGTALAWFLFALYDEVFGVRGFEEDRLATEVIQDEVVPGSGVT
mgnify:CR=1 FL=1